MLCLSGEGMTTWGLLARGGFPPLARAFFRKGSSVMQILFCLLRRGPSSLCFFSRWWEMQERLCHAIAIVGQLPSVLLNSDFREVGR